MLGTGFTVTGVSVYGVFPGWQAVSLSGGSDGRLRLLWDNLNGAGAAWILGNDGSVQQTGVFGPF
jgi:hypothetical protein